jgi:hypothetical protein
MSSVFDTVKTHILGFPRLYERRAHVLVTMFLGLGTGYGWNERGQLQDRHGLPADRSPGAMYYGDLDKSMVKFGQRFKRGQIDSLQYTDEVARLNISRSDRTARALEVDTISAETDTFEVNLDMHTSHELALSAVGAIPYDTVEEDWALAALCVVNQVLAQVDTVSGLAKPDVDRSRVPAKWLDLHMFLEKVQDELIQVLSVKYGCAVPAPAGM